MQGLIDIQIGDGWTVQYAVAGYRIFGFPKLSIWTHVYNGSTPGMNLCDADGRAPLTSIFLRARWVDSRGALFEADSLFPCTVYLGHARKTLVSLLTSPEFAANSIQPLLAGIRDQVVGRTSVKPVNSPLPLRLTPPGTRQPKRG